MDIDSMKTRDSYLELSGASQVSGNTEMVDGRFDLSGASFLKLEGSANYLHVEASGVSHIRLPDFTVVDI